MNRDITFAEFVGERIRRRRNELGLTMRDLDEYISPPYLSDVEHGKRKIGYEKLYHLAVVLGKSMNWFSEGWIDK